MKKLFLPFLLMLLVLTGCDGVVEKEKFVIGIDDEYAPMGFRNEAGEIIGFDVDLAKEAARRMGVEFEFRPIIWDKKFEELDSGRIDIIWNGFDITPDRQKHVLYSKSYMTNRQVLLIKKGNDWQILSAYDLEDKIVATQSGSHAETYIEENIELKGSFKEFKTYRTFSQAYKALIDEDIDVLIVDELVGRYETSRHNDTLEVVEVTIGPVTEMGIGFRKDDVKLRDKVQAVFDEMIKDGTAKKISIEWFQADLIKSKK